MKKFRKLTMIGLIAIVPPMIAMIGQGVPAIAAPANSSPTITIAAKSANPVVTGDVWVVYQGGKWSRATLSGRVTGVKAGDVVKIYAQRFPYDSVPVHVGRAIRLTVSRGRASYRFLVQPSLATSYQAKVFASPTSSKVLARSALTEVYAVADISFSGNPSCNQPGQRPWCTIAYEITVTVPASALRTEEAKKWFAYFGVNLAASKTPPAPKKLKLGAGHPKFVQRHKIGSDQFKFTVKETFYVGNDSYNYDTYLCSRDTESADGMNLPGHHGCGTRKVVPVNVPYLG